MLVINEERYKQILSNSVAIHSPSLTQIEHALIPYLCLQSDNHSAMRLNEYNASTSVYLEQIGNHIQVGEGYSQLRKHLFRELHQLNNGEVVSDDRLSDSVVSYLATALNKAVNFHRSAQTFRILQIIEDLLTYAEEVMTPAMHTELFVSALVYTANPKIITFDSKTDGDCRAHALGIFLFWFDRYGREEECSYELFIRGYRDLRDKKLLFPNEITIKPSDFFKKELEGEKNAPKPAETNEGKTNRIILEDIQAFTIKTESLFKQNFKSIATTEYVRLIKHKSKTLFQFTSKPNDFKDKEKNLVKDLYKRLRVVLKELDKFKETSLQTKKSEVAQKQYVEAKMTHKKAPPVEMSPLADKTQPSPQKKGISAKTIINAPILSQNIDLLDMAPAPKVMSTPQKKTQPKKTSTPKIQQPLTVDLLSDGPKQDAQIEQQQEFVEGIVVTGSETQNNFKKKQQQALFQVFSTPKKQVHEEEGGLLAKQSSNNSQDLSPGFENEKMAKNPYSFIPEHLNLTPTSSVQDEEEKVKDKPSFSFFGLFNKAPSGQPQGLQEQSKHYDSIHKKGKAFSEQTPEKVVQTINQQPLSNIEVKDIVNSPNYKPVAAVNYEMYAKFVPESPQKDEESKFELTPKKSGDKQLKQAEFDTPKSGKMIKQSEQ